MDTDNSGYLTREEILAATKNEHKVRLPKNVTSNLLAAWVKDGDNKVHYGEFLRAWLGQRQEEKIPTF